MTVLDGGLVDYECPFTETYRTATATHDARRGVLVHVATDDGVLGLGEAAPLSNRTEPLEACRRALQAALTELEEAHRTLEQALEDLDEILPRPGEHRAARFGLALALLDALARREQRPLSHVLADRAFDEATAALQVPVNATIPDGDLQRTRQRASRAAEEGFDVVKLKAGRQSFDHDVQRLEALREAAPELGIRLDVNGAWSSVDESLDRLQRLEGLPLDYVEQPLPPEDLDGMAEVRASTEVEVAADEPARDPSSARAVLEAGACDVLVVKPMVLGGPKRALEVAHAAAKAGVDVVVTTTIDAAIARAGTLHTAAALGSTPRAHGLATGWMLEDEPATFDEQIKEGHMRVPQHAGHGASRQSGRTRTHHQEGT